MFDELRTGPFTHHPNATPLLLPREKNEAANKQKTPNKLYPSTWTLQQCNLKITLPSHLLSPQLLPKKKEKKRNSKQIGVRWMVREQNRKTIGVGQLSWWWGGVIPDDHEDEPEQWQVDRDDYGGQA